MVFSDVRKDPNPSQRFGIRGGATQIFFDQAARDVYRHLGFLSDEGIIRQLKAMGVE
jgi:thioredoxin 1